MAVLLQSLTVGANCIDIWDWGLVTRLPDGAELHACPHDTDEYRATAKRLGYGDDTLLQCQKHEMGHTVLSVLAGLEHSPTLWHVAHGSTFEHWREEEAAVFAFQTYLRTIGRPMIHAAWALMKPY